MSSFCIPAKLIFGKNDIYNILATGPRVVVVVGEGGGGCRSHPHPRLRGKFVIPAYIYGVFNVLILPRVVFAQPHTQPTLHNTGS